MTDTARVKLSHPIEVGTRTIAEVTIRRPKVRDLRAMEKAREPGMSEIDQGVAMAAALCDLPLEAPDHLLFVGELQSQCTLWIFPLPAHQALIGSLPLQCSAVSGVLSTRCRHVLPLIGVQLVQ